MVIVGRVLKFNINTEMRVDEVLKLGILTCLSEKRVKCH